MAEEPLGTEVEAEGEEDFGCKDDDGNIVLIVENKQIPYPRDVLIRASPVFKTMLTSDFVERGRNEIHFEGKQKSAFMTFLRILYPGKIGVVNEKNVNGILPLAHEYEVLEIIAECERVLARSLRKSYLSYINQIERSSVRIFEHIHLALKYELKDLEKLAKKVASELKHDERVTAGEGVPDNIMAEINDMAIRRLEAESEDWEFAYKNKSGIENMLLQNISSEQKSHYDYDKRTSIYETSDEVHKRQIIGSRRIYAILPAKKEKAITTLRESKPTYSKDSFKLYDSLPEIIKHDVENLDITCPICNKKVRCSCLKTCYLNDSVVFK